MKSLFEYPKEIPKHIPEVTMYRISKYRTYSRREINVQRDLDARVNRYAKLFKVDGKPLDLGERVFLENKDWELEIYCASDSLRLSHKELNYREEIPARVELPKEKEAFETAKKFLMDNELDIKYTNKGRLDYTVVAQHKLDEDSPKLVKTEAHVIHNFCLDDFPVFGPGAKIKVSLVENNTVSGLVYFWRNPVEDRKMSIIHPIHALKLLTDDRGFRNLSPETASVTFHSIQFGYYSLTPTDFQRFMIPVYAIKGTVETKFMEPYNFTRYVVAVDLSFDEIKKLGVVANPYHCGII